MFRLLSHNFPPRRPPPPHTYTNVSACLPTCESESIDDFASGLFWHRCEIFWATTSLRISLLVQAPSLCLSCSMGKHELHDDSDTKQGVRWWAMLQSEQLSWVPCILVEMSTPPSPKERQVLFPMLPKQSHSLIVWGPPFTSRYFLLALPPCKRSLLTCRVLHCGLGDSEKRSSRKGGQVQLGWFVVSHHNVHPRVHQIPIIKSLFPCPRARILPEVILSRTSTHEQTRLFC